jgi:membrane associated rhomboid family serine protease
MVAIMWVAEAIDAILPWQADALGIRSRSLDGLPGIALSPFLHQGFGHLMANTVPLLVLGLLVAWRARERTIPAIVTIVLLGGAVVWLLGPAGAITIGASGLVFGLLGYLIAAGVITRHLIDILIAVGVLLIYGSLLGGVLPFNAPAGVSWLAHLAGFAAGIVAAVRFPPRPPGA